MTIIVSLIGSFILSIFGFFLAKLVVEPVGIQQSLRKRIVVSLRYYANIIHNSNQDSDEMKNIISEARVELRTLGCEIMASYYLIADIEFIKKCLIKLGWILSEENCRHIGRLLTFLSNNINNKPNNDETIKYNRVAKELIHEFVQIPNLDYGWMGDIGANLKK